MRLPKGLQHLAAPGGLLEAARVVRRRHDVVAVVADVARARLFIWRSGAELASGPATDVQNGDTIAVSLGEGDALVRASLCSEADSVLLCSAHHELVEPGFVVANAGRKKRSAAAGSRVRHGWASASSNAAAPAP